MNRFKFTAAAIAAAFLIPTAASAQNLTATVGVDLNLRVGPGPAYDVVNTIPTGTSVVVYGCVEGLGWCDVEWNGTRGWVYSSYIVVGGAPIAQAPTPPPIVVYNGEEYFNQYYQTQTFYNNRAEIFARAGGVGVGAAIGAIIAGPIGAAVGAAVGGVVGAAIVPPDTVVAYIRAQPQPQPIYLEGEVVVGAILPDTVTLATIPDYTYGYASVNGRIVLADPSTRAIVYVMN